MLPAGTSRQGLAASKLPECLLLEIAVDRHAPRGGSGGQQLVFFGLTRKVIRPEYVLATASGTFFSQSGSLSKSSMIASSLAATSARVSPWQHCPTKGQALPMKQSSSSLHSIKTL